MEEGLAHKVRNFISGKCKHVGDCALYDNKSVTCNKNRGRYYTDLSLGLKLKPFDFPGCYRDKEKESEKNKRNCLVIYSC